MDQTTGWHAAGAANWITCSANEVFYPVKWDHMLVKGGCFCRVCIIPSHERDVFQSISLILDMLELEFYQGYSVLLRQTKRGRDPGMIR